MSPRQNKDQDELGDARREVERSRSELEATLDAVAHRLDPKNIADTARATVADAAGTAQSAAASAVTRATDWVKRTLHRPRD